MMATLAMVLNVKKLTNVRLELMNVTKMQFVSTLRVFINANAVMDFMETVEFAKMSENKKLSEEENELSEIVLDNEYPLYLNLIKSINIKCYFFHKFPPKIVRMNLEGSFIYLSVKN